VRVANGLIALRLIKKFMHRIDNLLIQILPAHGNVTCEVMAFEMLPKPFDWIESGLYAGR
jgi:hypothetical protein